jgi:hypothetical protein
LGAVHFHSPEFQRQFVAASYIFARDASGDVIRFAPTDASLFSVLAGGGNAVYTSINSKEGTKSDVATKRTEAFEGGTETINRDETHQSDIGGDVQARVQMVARTPEELVRLAAHNFSKLKKQAYNAELDVRGTHAVGVLDYVEVRYVKQNGQDHYLSGVFRVYQLRHEVTTGGWQTTMTLGRAGTKAPIPDAPQREGQLQGKIPETAETQKFGVEAQIGASAAGSGPASSTSRKTVR